MPPRSSTTGDGAAPAAARRRARAGRGASRKKPAQALVRMYGQGVGDCFLLALPRAGAGREAAPRPVYVVIDCGVVPGTPGGSERMRQVVADIGQTTDRHVDLLIVSHEHMDHVSGFKQAAAEWATIQVDALWLAWTERPAEDGLPDALRDAVQRVRAKQRLALAQLVDRAARFGLDDRYPAALELTSFLFDSGEAGSPFAFAETVREAFDSARGLLKDAGQPTYCEPGDVRPVPGTDVLAYVLGPPQSDARLRQVAPSAAGETYDAEAAAPAGGGHGFSLERMAAGRTPFNVFAGPLVSASLRLDDAGEPPSGAPLPGVALDVEAERALAERCFPFDRTVRVPFAVAEAAAASGAGEFPALDSYFDDTNHWRRIDFDWLGLAEAFALQADGLTNNTSLALAFELPPAAPDAERKVLLFTGDAQVGNLLSWDDITDWRGQDGATPSQPEPNIDDLLARVAFYKVGHHGSHNATLKAKGVERMRRDGTLTAFVPVSPTVAREVKGWCEMPLDVLLDALAERAPGRVVLPNGNVWPPVEGDDQVAQARQKIGLTVSPAMLPPTVRGKGAAQEQIEGPIPLWVQIAIDC